MATLLLQAVGSIIAGPIGAAIGALAGTAIDRALIGGPNVRREGPRLADLTVQNSSYGEALPLLYGSARIAGNIIWSSGLIERRSEQSQGGGKSGSVTSTTYSYFASFAVALAGHEIGDLKRVWADGKLLRTADGTLLPGGQMRLHRGTQDQMPDSLIEAAVGVDFAPAHRGMAYVVFEELPLADFANRIPNLTFEVQAQAGAPASDMSIVLRDALTRCDIRSFDVPNALRSVPGFVVARESTARDVIDSLYTLQPFAFSDRAGTLEVNAVNFAAADHTLNARRLGATMHEASTGAPADERKLAPAIQLPGELQLRYSDAARDYQTSIQRARRFDANVTVRRTVDYPGVLAADTAKQLAEQLLARLWRERQTRQVRLPLSAIFIRPGQTATFSEAHESYWLIQSIALEDGGLTLDLLPLGLSDLTSVAAADEGAAVSQNPQLHGPTQGWLLDVPSVEPILASTPRLFAVAAGLSAAWRRASLWVSVDQGQSYISAGSLLRPVVLGRTLTGLGSASAAIWDEFNSVDVELLNSDMHLLSRSASQTLSGFNLALIGEELVSFRTAVEFAPKQYRLSGLLRGARGTEIHIGGHTHSERFVLLSPLPDVVFHPPLAAMNQLIYAKFLSPGQALGDAPAEILEVHGAAQRPLSPVHGRVERLQNGDWRITWVRRSRDGFFWLDGIDAPLAEASELYRLTIKVGGVIQRTETLGEASYLYTSSNQLSDGITSGSVSIEIAQLSASVGPGAPLHIEV